MLMGIYTSAAFINATGVANIGAGATIEVRRESDNGLAAIYADSEGASLILNPSAFADPNGRFHFYAPGLEGGYSVKVTSGVNVDTVHNQAIGTAQYVDITTYGISLIGTDDTADLVALLGYTERFAKLEHIERIQRRARLYAAQALV